MATLTLHNGDCIEIMKDISANSIDLIICDLPYGCLTADRKGKRVGELKDPNNPNSNIVVVNNPRSWDVKIDLSKFWEQARRILKNDHSPVIHFCTTKFGFELYESNPDWFRYDIVWNKERGVSFLSANKMPMRSHEMIYVFSKKGAYYNRKDIEGDYGVSRRGKSTRPTNVYNAIPTHTKDTPRDKRCALSVVKFQTKAVSGKHPTEKPAELYRFLIERYCPAGGTVLDPTFGSGNSVFTAFEMGRSAIGIEKDEKFFKKAEERLQSSPDSVSSSSSS